jgi:hypothetical protein
MADMRGLTIAELRFWHHAAELREQSRHHWLAALTGR